MLKYWIDRQRTQEICDKAVDALLPALKFVPDYFVTNELLEKLANVVKSNDDIFFVDVDSDVVTFFNDDMAHNTINLNINFDDDNVIRVGLVAWCNKYKQRKTCKKEISNKLMPAVWHPTRWWDW